MTTVPPDLLAALADRYALEGIVGEGGMATVYRARDRRHDREVAVKVLRPELSASIGSHRFLKEVEIAARLSHPHIVPLYDSGEADGFLFYVMPHIRGHSLRVLLRRERRLPLSTALDITGQVSGGLSYAHRMGVLHRDIKPENILLTEGHAFVVDFGVAKALDQAAGATLTKTGFALGTPGYMSPEQAAGVREIDVRADVYGLACVVYRHIAYRSSVRRPGSGRLRPPPASGGSWMRRRLSANSSTHCPPGSSRHSRGRSRCDQPTGTPRLRDSSTRCAARLGRAVPAMGLSRSERSSGGRHALKPIG